MKTKIALTDNEWGQVVDGLTCRAELYDETVDYYETGVTYGNTAEVSGVEEARSQAKLYRFLIAQIQSQR